MLPFIIDFGVYLGSFLGMGIVWFYPIRVSGLMTTDQSADRKLTSHFYYDQDPDTLI